MEPLIEAVVASGRGIPVELAEPRRTTDEPDGFKVTRQESRLGRVD